MEEEPDSAVQNRFSCFLLGKVYLSLRYRLSCLSWAVQDLWALKQSRIPEKVWFSSGSFPHCLGTKIPLEFFSRFC